MDEQQIAAMHQEIMNRVPVEKTWSVGGRDGQGAARMTMRMPDVTITDGEGRHIVLTPGQSAVIGRYMSETLDWLEEFDPESA
ncbi:hypothetical protein [Actinokineospora sp.]|uniref:hypothetical protein n=1 Tax=Actinokineospora sp. TaxID=1872133 RepID=UPI004037A6C2